MISPTELTVHAIASWGRGEETHANATNSELRQIMTAADEHASDHVVHFDALLDILAAEVVKAEIGDATINALLDALKLMHSQSASVQWAQTRATRLYLARTSRAK